MKAVRTINVSVFLAAMAACGQTPPEPPAPPAAAEALPPPTSTNETARPLRFAVMDFSHETCTFCPGGDTGVEDWTRIRPEFTGDEVFEAGPYMRGFVAAAGDYMNVELIGLPSPVGVYGGSSRSWNTEESFDYFVGNMLDALKEAGPVDGVFLSLHGAMATRGIPRPEAEVAKRFREAVGPDVPIVATFDLHGNEDGEFLRWADMAFTTKRFPHYDSYLQGERAARSLVRLARGTYVSTTASRKPGIVTPTVVQWTGASPTMDIMERARRWEARVPDAFVSVFLGFPWSDVPDIGAAIHVMTNDDQDMADEIADDMNEYMNRLREPFVKGPDIKMPEEAVRLSKIARAEGAAPIALADYSDRSGDSTFILREVIDQNLGGVLIGSVRDERAIEAIESAGLAAGDAFDMEVGGFMGEASGEPVRVTGELAYLGPGLNFDEIAIVSFGEGNALMITPTLRQLVNPEQMRVGPIKPEDFDIFVVKSRVHFRRGFDETGFAMTIHIVDAPGAFIGTTRLDALTYENVDLKTMYPYDQ
ncbi:MAG: M81 family metallopeptidase [Pseudomonadota bacterium]